MVNTRSSTRIAAELEKRGIKAHGNAQQERDLYMRIVTTEKAAAQFMAAQMTRPSHPYNLRPRKMN